MGAVGRDIYYPVGLSSHMTTITNQRRNQPGKTTVQASQGMIEEKNISVREKFVLACRGKLIGLNT